MVLIVLGIILSGQAFGFDVDGYRSGMSLPEVQRRAGKLDRISGSYVVMTPSGPFGPSFIFCDDKLSCTGSA
jgi:hypothetical protein